MAKQTDSSSSKSGRTSAAAELHQKIRCAVRFPLSLPVVLWTQSGEVKAETRNVSSNGVLFDVSACLPVGQDIRFSLRMPGGALGASHDVTVRCTGRVVRCSSTQGHYHAAATIDEYQFVDQ